VARDAGNRPPDDRPGPAGQPYKLINVGSIASRKPLVDVTVYCTSKYGCLALTHCGALALAEHNITVNGYAPGVVVTPLWEQLDKDLVEIGFKEKEGQAYEDIVANNLQSSSACPIPTTSPARPRSSPADDSDYMTGQMIHIDGGWCIE
jgi:NAD(P)-dependent dehydrogenase (short-subunit alcohol dehydrogenase family)